MQKVDRIYLSTFFIYRSNCDNFMIFSDQKVKLDASLVFKILKNLIGADSEF